jgi:hypothetical protein
MRYVSTPRWLRQTTTLLFYHGDVYNIVVLPWLLFYDSAMA